MRAYVVPVSERPASMLQARLRAAGREPVRVEVITLDGAPMLRLTRGRYLVGYLSRRGWIGRPPADVDLVAVDLSTLPTPPTGSPPPRRGSRLRAVRDPDARAEPKPSAGAVRAAA